MVGCLGRQQLSNQFSGLKSSLSASLLAAVQYFRIMSGAFRVLSDVDGRFQCSEAYEELKKEGSREHNAYEERKLDVQVAREVC